MRIEPYLKKKQIEIEKALSSYLPAKTEHPARLHEAMRYAVLNGGKRLRPILVLAACEAVGGNSKNAMPAACAIELIHNYSLVHDDLPCMDNDDFRRGKPTCHKKYGEGTAVLAGDALLTLAFEILHAPTGFQSQKILKNFSTAAQWVAQAIGTRGMVGGQALDIETQNGKKEMDLPSIEFINTHKTGALISVSTRVGALLGGGNLGQIQSLYTYGRHIGLLFQIVDDILDREGYAKLIGVPEARKEAENLLLKAKSAVLPLGAKGRTLQDLAEMMTTRKK